ncbi:MAG: hypothetical protein KGJ84_10390 [Elusimicrobia bacterium]|nr:hypothetical protein [Elusimicrobiota bacterium]
MDKRLKARLGELPRGSILKRRIGRKDYYYLKLRDGDSVESRYLGKERPADLDKSLAERRLIRRQIKEVRENLKILARVGKRRSKK